MAKQYYLSFEDRQKISQWYLERESAVAIAERLGFDAKTIYREIEKGYTGQVDKNGRPEYDPELAQRVFDENRKEGQRKNADIAWKKKIDKWSNEACLGHVSIACKNLEYEEAETEKLLAAVNSIFDVFTLDEAKNDICAEI